MANESYSDGGCNCGAIRYRVSGPAHWSAGCCCRDCTLAAGAPLQVWSGFPPDKVTFLKGSPKVFESSEGVLRGFCPECGTSLTYGRAPGYEGTSPILYVSTITLDRPEDHPPEEVVWYERRASWLSLDSSIPCHDTVSPAHAGLALNNSRPPKD